VRESSEVIIIYLDTYIYYIYIIYNVGKTIINHPQFHHFYRWYKPFPGGRFMIVLTTLPTILQVVKGVAIFYPGKW